MEFLYDYGLFLAKTLTVVVAVAAVLLLVALGRRHGQAGPQGQIRVLNLGERLRDLRRQMQSAVLDKAALKRIAKAEKLKAKASRAEGAERPRVFVLNFHGDLRATAVDCLREEISAVLAVASEGERVLVRLESAGGLVHGYGLAASQLRRLRDRGLKLHVAVDKVAASGGYMMACVAERISVAPFAVLGSIGVVAQLPNFNRLLKKHDVDIELHTAGEYKRTLTILGENSDKGREKFKAELEAAHALFKRFIADNRPSLDLAVAATGEHWYGSQALELGLADDLATSDQLLLEYAELGEVYEVVYKPHKRWTQRLALQVENSLARLGGRVWQGAATRPEV